MLILVEKLLTIQTIFSLALVVSSFYSPLAYASAPFSINEQDLSEKSFAEELNEKDKLKARDPTYLFIQKKAHFQEPIFPIKLESFIIELLQLDQLDDENDSFHEVVAKTQKKWLATVQGTSQQANSATKTKSERSDFIDSSAQIKIKEKVEKIARAMGLFDKREAALAHYKYGAWLGSFLQGARSNLKTLVEAWQKGHHFEKLVVFTGERYLRKEEGQEDDIKNLCNPKYSPLPFKAGWELPQEAKYETEYDMMQLIFDQIQLPKEMEEALTGHIEFVNAAKGSHVRPGTKDCYVEWLKTNPEPGTLLAASYPLLWVIQHLAGKAVLGDHFPLDTVAPALSLEEYEKRKKALVSLIQDTVTKCLFEIDHSLKSQEISTKIISFPKEDKL